MGMTKRDVFPACRIGLSVLLAAFLCAGATTAGIAQSAAPRTTAQDVNTPLPSSANIGQQSIGSILPEPIATWNGLRPFLADRGIAFAFTYGQLDDGCVRRCANSAAYMGRLKSTAEFNPEILAGWKGALFHASMYQIHGVGLSQHFVGSIAPVSDLEAVATTRLYELWVEQQFNDILSLRVGQLGVDTEFFLSPYYEIAVGGTFGWPTIVAANLPSGGPAYPFASPGVRLKVTPNDDLTLMMAIFDGDAAGPGLGDPQHRNRYGVNFRMSDPPFVIGEAQLKYGSADTGTVYPGTLRIGAWTHFGRFADPRFTDDGRPISDPTGTGVALQHRGDSGVSGVIDQQIYQRQEKKDDGIYVFARMSFSPSDRNLIDFYVDGGVTCQGLVPGRPDDQFAILGAFSKISAFARAANFDANFYNGAFAPARNYEALAEATYSMKVANGVFIQPNIQYVAHPGGGVPDVRDPLGVRAVPNALVLGLRTTIQY